MFSCLCTPLAFHGINAAPDSTWRRPREPRRIVGERKVNTAGQRGLDDPPPKIVPGFQLVSSHVQCALGAVGGFLGIVGLSLSLPHENDVLPRKIYTDSSRLLRNA
jgi:hypothetical protein